MTATAAVPARPAPRDSRRVPLGAARLLRIELRRNAMPWALPLIAALFWFDSYRPSTGQPPFWLLRTFWNMGEGHTIIDFGPFVAGVAAWMGSRDGRRGLADLVVGSARPRWTAQLATWSATAIWAVGGYLAFVGVMFAIYARQGVQGSPPWWWVAVGAAAVLAFSAAGFAVGALFPSRFSAPVAAFGGFLALLVSFKTGSGQVNGSALLLPTNASGSYVLDSGIFYPFLPDLMIARIIVLAGIAIAALGLTGLPTRAGGPWLRRVAALVTIAGAAAASIAVSLADTARLGPEGVVIPALHNAASDGPLAYTPACGKAGAVPICVNPAYRGWLTDLTAALRPVLAETAGLPGAPARVTQVAAPYLDVVSSASQAMTLAGQPPVLRMSIGALGLPGTVGGSAVGFADVERLLAVHAFVAPGSGPAAPAGNAAPTLKAVQASLEQNHPGTPVQQAVQAGMLQDAGVPLVQQPGLLSGYGVPQWGQATLLGLTNGKESASGPGPLAGPIYAAAVRFAALPAATRHAWLAAHLPALRAGHLTLAQLP
jgi:hypothetical protein